MASLKNKCFKISIHSQTINLTRNRKRRLVEANACWQERLGLRSALAIQMLQTAWKLTNQCRYYTVYCILPVSALSTWNVTYKTYGRSGLVVTRLPAAREGPGSNRAADKSLCFQENHCDTQLWARAAHWLQYLGRLSLPPSEGR